MSSDRSSSERCNKAHDLSCKSNSAHRPPAMDTAVVSFPCMLWLNLKAESCQCTRNQAWGCISAHSLPSMFYPAAVICSSSMPLLRPHMVSCLISLSMMSSCHTGCAAQPTCNSYGCVLQPLSALQVRLHALTEVRSPNPNAESSSRHWVPACEIVPARSLPATVTVVSCSCCPPSRSL